LTTFVLACGAQVLPRGQHHLPLTTDNLITEFLGRVTRQVELGTGRCLRCPPPFETLHAVFAHPRRSGWRPAPGMTRSSSMPSKKMVKLSDVHGAY
jgi:hypothetical protein